MKKKPQADLKRYRDFLASIPLARYRDETRGVKWVEVDLPWEIQPWISIYRNYWDNKSFLDFDKWFESFWEEINKDKDIANVLREFKSYYFDNAEAAWFKTGFRARMYRTWVSGLTQLDFCYMFRFVAFKKRKDIKLECSAELDKAGIDAKAGDVLFQIKKVTQRKEARRVNGKVKVIVIPYAVFDIEEFERKTTSPRVKDKDGYKNALKAFNKYLLRLPNGFIVFSEKYLEPIINNIRNSERVRPVVSLISSELAGEKQR